MSHEEFNETISEFISEVLDIWLEYAEQFEQEAHVDSEHMSVALTVPAMMSNGEIGYRNALVSSIFPFVDEDKVIFATDE